jgi:serine/threonine protein kinase
VWEASPEAAQRSFGRYTLLERIGAGGMAEVFRAVARGAEGFERTLVVKRIRADQSASPTFVEMFVNEARISALLDHPNIVQTYDFGQVDGCYFLTMEYLRGRDFGAVLRRLRSGGELLDPALAAFVAAEVANGLAYAHALCGPGGEQLDIVHRDVSPANIMLLRSGGVKLVDFGVAKIHGDLQRGEDTATGVCKGKLPYLSPEQLRELPLDGRTDVFALGVVLWEALTGRRLFLDKNDYQTMQNVAERPIPPPSTLRPDTPTALDFVVVRALERDPGRRYPSARAMAEDLHNVVQELRYHSDSVTRLLDRLFGDEDGEARTPAMEAATDLLALGAEAPASSLDGDEGGGRTVMETGVRLRRRRRAQLVGAAVVGGAVLLGGLWSVTRSLAKGGGPRPPAAAPAR